MMLQFSDNGERYSLLDNNIGQVAKIEDIKNKEIENGDPTINKSDNPSFDGKKNKKSNEVTSHKHNDSEKSNSLDFFAQSAIVDNQYDSYFKEWIGNNTTKLLYRASKYKYDFQAFHDLSDNYKDIIIIYLSKDGWIFGGYTTQSWSNSSKCISYSSYQ